MEKELKAGHLLMVSEGCYSDYGVTGFFVALATFKPLELRTEFLAAHPEQEEMYRFRGETFMAFLIRKGLLLEITHASLHLGDYSTVKEMSFTPVGEA
jgi:hypothetical protein